MAAPFPTTSLNLLTKLKQSADDDNWNVSWKRFLELYHEPLTSSTRACYRFHTNGHEPAYGFIEEVVAQVVTDFFSKSLIFFAKKSRSTSKSYLSITRKPCPQRPTMKRRASIALCWRLWSRISATPSRCGSLRYSRE